jgi:hypothetical protein
MYWYEVAVPPHQINYLSRISITRWHIPPEARYQFSSSFPEYGHPSSFHFEYEKMAFTTVGFP